MFAVYHYDYNHYSTYTPHDVNLGDYIQSLAASQYLQKIDTTIDRDSILPPPSRVASLDEKVFLIANAWYHLDGDRHRFPETFLPVSIHISNTSEAPNLDLGYLKRLEPIGCRDKNTLRCLESLGIKAYFSSCLTTTLDIKYAYDGPRQGIIFSDLDFTYESGKLAYDPLKKLFPLNKSFNRLRFLRFVAKELSPILHKYLGEEVRYATHSAPLSTPHEERFALAEDLLKTYASAKLVVTSRIHAALPCLALGTPVILVTQKYDPLRYEGLDDFLNHIWIKDGAFEKKILTENGFVRNSNLFKPYAEKLKETCRSWVDSIS